MVGSGEVKIRTALIVSGEGKKLKKKKKIEIFLAIKLEDNKNLELPGTRSID